ncbi:DUF4124 domain-containing protein [Microbulbifer yueqingensis]|uniref:DUF4124 domain-containing protein n=1 Tax=Microbulbifer yueqingensis TaxID=658219 RepID=A0A1G9EX48_9GAMM|nr:DUF4124 domain-containing protein [Microbulbifer yueqingensis]SDK80757.1 protein of unknown function [Microbulbifer yueqingensis]
MRFLSAILLASLASATLADGIYKWKDENGVVHFGSQPPQEKKVEVVKEPRSERYKQWKKEQQAAKAQQAPDDEASLTETARKETAAAPDDAQDKALSQAQKAVRAQRCRQAQNNLQELSTHSQVREVDASGKLRVLPEEERQARIRRAREVIEKDC